MKYCVKGIKIRLLYFILGLITTLFSVASTAKAQYFKFDHNRYRDRMTFDLIKNLIIVPVYVNNKGPFNFLLDTGVGPMIITDPALIDSLSLKDLRPIKIAGFGVSEDINASVAVMRRTSLGEAYAENIPTIVLKEDVFKLSSYVGKTISGLIGYNFFNSFVVKINYLEHRLAFNLPEKSRRIKGEKITIELLENKPYLTAKLESPTLGKVDVKLIIDCGASHALSLEAFQNKAYPTPKETIIGNLGVGLGGEISGLIGRTNSLSIGSFTLNNVLTNFPKYNEVGAKSNIKERNGNLGSEVLRRFEVTFDYKNKAMYLKKNVAFEQPFEHDMSGVEIYRDGPVGPFLLGRIEPGSPAEKAELLPNDEVVSINFKKIEDYTIDEIVTLLKSGNGKTLIMEIFRDRLSSIKILKLKKRI